MHVASGLHVAQYVVLQISDRFEGIWNVLILLNIPDDVSGFGAFGKVDEVGPFNDRGYAILNEGEISKIDA